MKKWLQKTTKSLKKELRSHKFIYLLLLITFLGGLFVRVYRTGQILGFYYDQGRDAIRIWELWHNFDVFLIGPTTGIAGVYRGPFYYYLIAPFYLISGGNPLLPSYFLALLSMIAVLVLYALGTKIADRATGLFVAILASFSFYIMVASRWLSNPTPMLLLSVLLVWNLFFIHDNNLKKPISTSKKNLVYGWSLLGMIAGLSLFHFGSSGEFFYFPAIAVFAIWQVARNKKGFKGFREVISFKSIIFSLGALLFTASPLILFDYLKGHILSQNLHTFLFEQESFKSDFKTVFAERMDFYYSVFTSKIFHWIRRRGEILLIGVGVSFLAFIPKFLRNDYIKIVMLLLFSPIVGLLFFQGNFGNIYDYYMTGYYLIFILLFGVVLGSLWRYKLGKLFVLYFFFVFLTWNGMISRYHIIAGVDGENTIAFGNQKQAIEWIYEDAEGKPFNVDVYVPPVIPHAYDYLFTWYGSLDEYYPPSNENLQLLYTLYEVDPPHPERLDLWLSRQQGIGSVEETVHFGGITVQRRVRFMQ